MTEQIRFRTLLKEDPLFKAWFQKVPRANHALNGEKPWRLFVQLEERGRWAKVDIRGYPEAFTQVKLRLPDCWDLALHSKGRHFPPPVLRYNGKLVYWPVPDGHTWCSLCRRPTVFKRYTKHPMIPFAISPEEPRCCLCGVRRESLKQYRTPLEWPVTT